MKPIMLVVGTRPEGIKMMPVYFALKQAGYPVYLCSTTQHDTLLSEVFSLFKVVPDCQLGVMKEGQDLFHITTTVLERIKAIYEAVNPSCVLVQGDTTTAMAAGLAAYYKQIPLGHVEAGLRTGDKCAPFPEEVNRQLIGSIADYHFAPTSFALANLLSEGKKRESIFCVGNTVVDALRIVQEKIDAGTVKPRADIEKAVASCTIMGQKMALLTVHRRESFGGGIEQVLWAIKTFALEHPDVFFFYPFHPNPHVLDAIKQINLGEIENIFITEPLTYKDLVYLLNSVHFVATDSGGIQEEAVSLGKPVVILREKSDRVEAVWEGLAVLAGTCPSRIIDALTTFYKNSQKASSVSLYGDGHAAQKIVRVLESVGILFKDSCDMPFIYAEKSKDSSFKKER